MSLFYDLKLKRQKAGPTSGPSGEGNYGERSSSSSISEDHDGDSLTSPSSSPDHDSHARTGTDTSTVVLMFIIDWFFVVVFSVARFLVVPMVLMKKLRKK